MPSRKLRDLMPRRPRCYEQLPEHLGERVAAVYRRLAEVPFIGKQNLEQWRDRFCYDPDPAREIAVWEWLAEQYEQRASGIRDQQEKNNIFKMILRETIDYEPLGVRRLPGDER